MKRLNKQAWEHPEDRPSADPDRDYWLFGPQIDGCRVSAQRRMDGARGQSADSEHDLHKAGWRLVEQPGKCRCPGTESALLACAVLAIPGTAKSISTLPSRPLSKPRPAWKPTSFLQEGHNSFAARRRVGVDPLFSRRHGRRPDRPPRSKRMSCLNSLPFDMSRSPMRLAPDCGRSRCWRASCGRCSCYGS